MFEAAARRANRDLIRFASCNLDDNQAVASLLGVRTIPTTIVFDADGMQVLRLAGVLPPGHLTTIVSRLEKMATPAATTDETAR